MEQIICIAILICAAVLFCTELVPASLTSMMVVLALILSGILTPAEAFSGFSNTTVILFASIFVISAALDKTDFVSICGSVIYRFKNNERTLILVIMIVTGVLSSILSTTGLAAILIPVIIGIARTTGFSRSRLLLPMAIAGSLGGGILVLGGGGNSAIYASLENLNIGMSFSFFDMPKVGIPAVIIAILYTWLFGWKYLPSRISPEDDLGLEDAGFKKSTLPKSKQIVIYTISVLTILVMIFEKQIGIKMYLGAMMGAVAIVLTRCLSEQEAIRGIRWQTLLMFAGILPLSTALTKTGVVKQISTAIIKVGGDSMNQYLIVGICLAVSMLFTQMMSNSAALALFCPLAGSIGIEIGADPRALIMAAALGASASLCTPIASPPEAMIYNVGGYKSTDYIKYSAPICIIILLFGTFYLPTLWPLF